MPKARNHQVSLDTTPYCHCVSRCVRRVFLCGTSRDGYCLEHRRQWMDSCHLGFGSISRVPGARSVGSSAEL